MATASQISSLALDVVTYLESHDTTIDDAAKMAALEVAAKVYKAKLERESLIALLGKTFQRMGV